MLGLAADENFNGVILRGLLRQIPGLDVVRVQDTSIYGAPDPEVLEWVAKEDRILLTHDLSTMPGYAYARAATGKKMADVFAIPLNASLSVIINDLVPLVEGSLPGEWANQVLFLPL